MSGKILKNLLEMSSVRPLLIGFAVGICFSTFIGIMVSWDSQWQGMPIVIHDAQNHPGATKTRLIASSKLLNGLERMKKNYPNRVAEIDLEIANIDLFLTSVDKSVEAFRAFNIDQHDMTRIIDIYQKMIVGIQSNLNKIVESKKIESSRKKISAGFVGKVMNDIANSADSLETSMNDQKFEKALNETSKVKTVVSVDKQLSTGFDVLRLVDSDENEYSLTKASDITIHYNDDQLFNEFLLVLLLALIGSYVLRLLGLPAFLGNLFIGGILGSYSYIKSIIPLDTLSRSFGSMFIMFAL